MKDSSLTVGIVGGRGRMGDWFRRFFEAQGLNVLISGRNTPLKPQEMAPLCDMVVISVPIGVTTETIRRVGPHVRQEALMTDLTSLKINPVKAMLEHSKAEVIGMHPLFGPGVPSLEGQNLILCPARGQKWLPLLQDMLSRNGARVRITTPEEHDHMMSIVQGLRYFCTLSVGGALMAMQARMEDCEEFRTPIFRLFLDVLGRLLAQDATLTAEICLHNPETMAAVRVFQEYAERWANLLAQGDQDGFVALFREIGDYFGGFSSEASKEIDYIIQALTRSRSQKPVDLRPEMK